MSTRFIISFSMVFGVCSVFAQQNIDVTVDYTKVSGIFPDSIYTPLGKIVFLNRQNPNTGNLLSYGLHFNNHTTTFLTNPVSGRAESDTTCTNFGLCEESQWYDSPLIGVHGANTVVYFSGNLRGDNSRSDPTIVVTDTGRFVVRAAGYIDLVFSRWVNFTRSLYVVGDGTGIFEIEEGFVSDRSAFGTLPCGTGAIRLNNVVFISHASASLPYYYRPKMSDTHAKINSHLVFHQVPGSKWIVRSNPQVFPGGVWVYESMTLDTEEDLTLTGRIDTFKYNEYYVNYGGLMFFNSNRMLTKTGVGALIIRGDQAYSSGSTIWVKDGRIEFATDPFMYGVFHFTKDKDFYTGRNLIVQLSGQSGLKVTAMEVNLHTLSVESAASSVYVQMGSRLNMLHSILNGRLVLVIPDSVFLPVNEVVFIGSWGTRSGRFTEVMDSMQRYVWDTARLYSHGELKVSAINVTRPFSAEKEWRVFPNPANGYINISLPEDFYPSQFTLYNLSGELVLQTLLNNAGSHLVFHIQPGILLYRIENRRHQIFTGKLYISGRDAK